VRVETTGKCACGRSEGMILAAIEGRSVNITLTCDGRLVTSRELDMALSVIDEIDEFKLEQTKPCTYELRIASYDADKQKVTASAGLVLKRLYGQDAKITVIHEDKIAPEVSGKYRLAKTLFPVNIEEFLQK